MLYMSEAGHVPIDIPARKASKEKLERDVFQLKQYARYVIVLEPGAIKEVIDNSFRVEQKLQYAALVVVVGPVWKDGAFIPEAPLLEIGYHRARPYRRIHSGNQVFLWERVPSRTLTQEEAALTYPEILYCFEKIVLETRKHWRIKERWVPKSGGHEKERGVQFTVSQSDQWLHQQLLKEYVRYMKYYFLRRYASWVSSHLVHYQYNRYSLKGYRLRAHNVWRSIRSNRYGQEPLLRETLLRILGKKRLLVESLMRDLGGWVLETDEEIEFVYGDSDFSFPTRDHLHIYKTPDQPLFRKNGHAQGCVRFEVMFERRWREEHEETRLIVSTKERPYDDCPF